MRISTIAIGGLMLAASATPAFADDAAPPPEFTINGTAAVVSDYRFRGISQTDKNGAIQGSITITHKSGFYASVWGSSIDDYVTAAGTGNQEIDIIGGYSHSFGSIKLDGGVLYYFYPKTKVAGVSSDFFEPYFDVSTTVGPVSAKATVNYAPAQKALGVCQGGCGEKANDNVYLAGDFSVAIPKTPLGLTAHVGHSWGPTWLTIGNEYTDYSFGATATYKMLTLGVSYVGTDGDFITPSGKNASSGGAVFSLTAAF
ncbi:TorF family putative porin [Sphingomonas immobilis]|uniref:TorF family putative porin n=1 Tax=Sphingomonas immobilis TaxID=3063997 RepID=A0ABT9A3V1_9SPHN|nr:TorF family putative porin [Sphingomonas sp. CA1-15]MDO7844515.1 TorF family putative porin [Sphingomonas sp. CA1-15]